MRRRIGILAVALVMPGCKKDACEDEPASFQLDIEASGAGARSLVIELVNGSARKRRAFELGGELDDGKTSIAIEVEQSLVGDVSITARTHPMPDGEGPALEEAQGSFAVEANGCNLFSLVLKATGDRDGGVDTGVDTGVEPEADAGMDGGEPPDAEPSDGDQPDADPVDGTPVDTGGCVEEVDPDTVALYSMEGDLTDETLAQDGTAEGNAIFEAGQCGQALRISGANNVQGYGLIADSTNFDVAQGSLDFWLRAATVANARAFGIASRDSMETGNGGFTLYLACDGTVVARLDDSYVCSDAPVTAGEWSYVGVNFGAAGLELWVGGARAARTAPVGLFGQSCAQTVQCGGTSTTGIAGNDNPWILGASADSSQEGMGSPLSLPFRDGLIDAFRISDVRRAF